MLKMYTLGHRAEMKPVRGDGLRYHGCSPILSLLRHRGLIDTIAYPTDERHVFERARMFVQTEGFLPAPESAYSIACAIDEALKTKETGERTVIAFNVSGTGSWVWKDTRTSLAFEGRCPIKVVKDVRGPR